MSSSSTTKLPPSNIGTGALYTTARYSAPTGRVYTQSIPTTSLRAAPIAHFASTPNDGIGNDGLKSTLNFNEADNAIPTAGRLLAINSHYIAYAVKKGLIRIIHRSSGSKTLLRGHSDKTRLVDCAFFGGNVNGNNSGDNVNNNNGVGVMGVWDELYKLHHQTSNGNTTTTAALSGGGGGTAQSQNQPPVAASDVLATLGGYNDTASILIWRIHSNNNDNVDGSTEELGADKLLEIQFGENRNSNAMKASSRIIWHPFNPNRFLLLHSNLSDDESESGKEGGEGGGRTVATLVETTKLVTMPYDGDDGGGHMVCNFSNTQATGNNNDDNEPQPAGTTPLTVYAQDDCINNNDLSLAGANDYTWSNTDARYVLTGHDDGYIRLWNLDERRTVRESTTSSIPCVASVNVIATATTTTTMKRVTRVIFLSQYVDGSSSSASDATKAITPPFITGTDMNRTITLWSSFGVSNDGNINSPSRLRVFGLRNGGDNDATNLLSSIMSVEMCPAPYRPALPPSSIIPGGIVSGDNDDDDNDNTMTTVPSSFLILAERTSGIIHALHMDTKWNENDNDATSSSPSSSSVVVKGFDYVSTLNVVHPIYSFCVAPPSPSSSIGGGGMTNNNNALLSSSSVLKEERDVDLCCIQSKAVQMLTLSADMCAPPDDDVGYGTELRGDLAPGVTLLDLPAVEVSDDEDDDNNNEEEEEFEEEDYDMEEDGLDVVEYSTNDSGEDDDEEDAAGEEDAAAAVPTASETNKPNAFSNWLGAIASPFTSPPPPIVEDDNVAAQKNAPPPPPKPSTESAKSPATSPPPGLGFQSVLPPPPPADMTPVQDATPTPPALLSPMQILSESGSGSDLNLVQSTAKQQQAPKSTAVVASSVPPPSKAAKKPTKKKGPDGKKAPPPVSSNQPTGPMKILQREEPKDETNVLVPPNAVDINAIEDTIQRIISTQMKSHETQLLTSLRKVISTEVSSAVSSAVRSSMKDTSKVTEQAISNQVESGKLGKKLEKHAKDSAALAAKETVGKMQPAIVNSLHETMKEVMIPAYEAATRQMFHQTSTSLEKGLAQMSANHTNAAVPPLEAISDAMKKMSDVIQSLSAEVTQLRGEINTANAANENGANQGQGGGVTAQPMGIRNEISASCQGQRYEEAFTKAVSASDGELVLFACKHADTAVVFAGDVSISQPILICLLQQLGAVLVTTTDTEDMKTILNWLQEIAVTIDPTNVNIQKHIGSVVQQLLVNINVKMSNCEPAFRRPLQTLMQVIRGLQ